jgi:hypothetical protein
MDARYFLELATELAAPASLTAVRCRTSLGRSYYAAFNSLAHFFSTFGIQITEGPGCHREIEGLINNTRDDKLNGLGMKLNQLKTRRHWADYEMHNREAESGGNAQISLKDAESIIVELDKIRSDRSRKKAIELASIGYAGTQNMKVKLPKR